MSCTAFCFAASVVQQTSRGTREDETRGAQRSGGRHGTPPTTAWCGPGAPPQACIITAHPAPMHRTGHCTVAYPAPMHRAGLRARWATHASPLPLLGAARDGGRVASGCNGWCMGRGVTEGAWDRHVAAVGTTGAANPPLVRPCRLGRALPLGAIRAAPFRPHHTLRCRPRQRRGLLEGASCLQCTTGDTCVAHVPSEVVPPT